MLKVNWDGLKFVKAQKDLYLHYTDTGRHYVCSIVDGPLIYVAELLKGSDEALDFESNFQSVSNRRVVVQQAALTNAEDFRFRGTGAEWTACAPGTTSFDLTPSATEDRWVDGGIILSVGANLGDYVTFQVVHPSYGPVETYVPRWNVLPGTSKQDISVYPARIPAGLLLRVVYTNVGEQTAHCAINYRLHRKGPGA